MFFYRRGDTLFLKKFRCYQKILGFKIILDQSTSFQLPPFSLLIPFSLKSSNAFTWRLPPPQTMTNGAFIFLISESLSGISFKGILILSFAWPFSNSSGLLTSIIIFFVDLLLFIFVIKRIN